MDKLAKCSVSLEQAAAEMLKTRGDFTIGELLNYAFMNAFEGQNNKWQSHLTF